MALLGSFVQNGWLRGGATLLAMVLVPALLTDHHRLRYAAGAARSAGHLTFARGFQNQSLRDRPFAARSPAIAVGQQLYLRADTNHGRAVGDGASLELGLAGPREASVIVGHRFGLGFARRFPVAARCPSNR